MNKFFFIALIGLLIVGLILASGCANTPNTQGNQQSQNSGGETQSNNQPNNAGSGEVPQPPQFPE